MRAQPGELIHIDITKLGRFQRPGRRVTGDKTRQSSPRSRSGIGYGWEYVHVCIGNRSRVAFSQIHPNEKAYSAVAFLKAAVPYYRSLGTKQDNLLRLHIWARTAPRSKSRGAKVKEQNLLSVAPFSVFFAPRTVELF